MSFKLEGSDAIIPDCVQIFDIKKSRAGIVRVHEVSYKPIGNLGEDGPYDFQISGSGAQYLYFKGTRVYAQIKIVKADGSDIASTENCGPINNTLDSLFRQVDVTLQDKLVSTADVSINCARIFMMMMVQHVLHFR